MNLLLRLISLGFAISAVVAMTLFVPAAFMPQDQNWMLPYYGEIEPWLHMTFYGMAVGALMASIIMLRQRQAFWGFCTAMLGSAGLLFAVTGLAPISGETGQIVFETFMMSFFGFMAFGITWPTLEPKSAPCFG